jgi:hypothetical protein
MVKVKEAVHSKGSMLPYLGICSIEKRGIFLVLT